jgi:hypothetical protein
VEKEETKAENEKFLEIKKIWDFWVLKNWESWPEMSNETSLDSIIFLVNNFCYILSSIED